MRYESASWRIEIYKGVHVEVSVTGQARPDQASTATDVAVAANVLRDVAKALVRVQARYVPSSPAPRET